jgi:peptidoglycan hydrolase-like protein with peptidoglycan-binding domain
LKLGSKGPNVVKLQKFLNDKIPGNPLTVNGVFDQKTADKLIEFQKKEGIIK